MTQKRWNGRVVTNVVTLAILGLVAVLQLMRPASAQFSPPSSTSQPLKWEYRSISATQETDPGYERFVGDMQDLGDLGFELVTCLYAPARDRDESTTACYFKRPQ
ncbi:MAG: hypothetical protein J7641_15750 [Cyanobacteria bacterium SID2]|nr:hypothetical protein [Cyanobacteria bacterium SID2]